MFTPKAFGWGYTINFYWLALPIRYFTVRSLPAVVPGWAAGLLGRYGRTAPMGTLGP